MDGYIRIKNLYLEGNCKDLYLKQIVAFLMKKTDMSNYYLNEEKNLKEMMDFIYKKAKEKAKNNMACLADEEVYQLAEKYFKNSNEELGIKTSTIKEKVETKEETKKDNQLSFGL